MTKRFEEIVSGTGQVLVEHYAAIPPPKGEVVLVIGPPEAPACLDDTQIQDRLAERMTTISLKQAVAEVTEVAGRPKREVYELALALKKDGP